MVSTRRSIARWLMHAARWVAILYDGIGRHRAAGIEFLAQARDLVAPKVLEPRRRHFGVAHGVLDIAVPEVRLKRPRIVPPVGQGQRVLPAWHCDARGGVCRCR